MTKNEVSVRGSEQLPAHLAENMEDMAGLGNSTSAQDNSLPFLAIVQSMSPQVDKQQPEYIKGIEVGDLFNTATGKFWKGEAGVDLIPFAFQKQFVEWVPRTSGGGYVASHPFDLEAARKMGASKDEHGGLVLPNGNQLVETAYTFVIPPDVGTPMVIGASSSALKPMRDWMSLRNSMFIGGKIAPAFARVYHARTLYQTNDKGAWYNWKISDVGWVQDKDLFERCVELAKAAAKGDMVVGRPPEPAADGDDGIPV